MTTIIAFLSVALAIWAIPYLVTFFDKRTERLRKQKKYRTRFYKESELKRHRHIEQISIRHLEKKVDYKKN
jgi:hypothetical protein